MWQFGMGYLCRKNGNNGQCDMKMIIEKFLSSCIIEKCIPWTIEMVNLEIIDAQNNPIIGIHNIQNYWLILCFKKFYEIKFVKFSWHERRSLENSKHEKEREAYKHSSKWRYVILKMWRHVKLYICEFTENYISVN